MVQLPDEVTSRYSLLLRSSKTLLQHPAKGIPHPQANKLNLLVCMLSDKNQEQQTFQQRALGSSNIVGVPRQPKVKTLWQLHWEMESVLSWKRYWSHFNSFRSANWISNQNLLIRCWVLISKQSKISPFICFHNEQWDLLWGKSPP